MGPAVALQQRSPDEPLRGPASRAGAGGGAARMLALQRAAGNAAVVRRLQPVPPSLPPARSEADAWMSHRYVGTDDHAYCNFCNDESCPKELSAEDALDNADSYSAFAYKLWPMTVLTG